MPYAPIPNPKYLHWEPWPHLYRRGMPAANVTAFHQRSLGETPTVPWQCWDMPGFKDCQRTCFEKAQKTGVSADAQAALVDQCMSLECVMPCKAKLAAQPASDSASTTGKKSMLDTIASSPMNIAAVAVLLAIGATLMAPRKKRSR